MPNVPIYRSTCLPVSISRLIFLFLFSLGFPVFASATGIDIPLTIRESAGVPRQQWLITTGVPLPKGAVRTLEKLQIMDTQGRFIPAQFSVASRWWADGSIRWVHCDFAASVEAHGSATYFLREVASLPPFPSPIGLMPRGKDFEIITGPLRMVLLGNSNQLLDQVWVDEGWGYNFNETNKILDSGNFQLTLTCDGRTYHASDWKKGTVEIEMVNALRAVIKIHGSFALEEQKVKKLDYLARITLYGGKTYFKLELTVFDGNQNSLESSSHIQDFAIRLKLNLNSSRQKFTLGGTKEDYRGNFLQHPMASMFEMTASQYQVFGAIEGNGEVEDNRAPNLGWVDLSDDEYGLSVGIRWFSKLFPKGFEVQDDGTVTIKLFPSLAPALEIPKGFCRTHELLFHFHGKRDFALGQVKNVMLGFQNPIYATAPASSYISDLVGSADLSRGSNRDFGSLQLSLVPQYEAWLITNRNATSAAMRHHDRGEVAGLLCFGDSLHFLRYRKSLDARADWQQTIGDFSHALYLHFLRTGDLQSLEFAEESVAYTVDFTRTHEIQDGLENRSGLSNALIPPKPALRAEIHRFYQVEGLLDSYLLTGSLRSLEAAKKSLEELLREDKTTFSHDLAYRGNILLCLARGYEVLGDQRLLERLNQLLDEFTNSQSEDPAHQREKNHEAWQYGILWDGLLKAERVTGRKALLDQIKNEAAGLLNREAEWDSESNRLRKYPQLSFLLAQGLASIDQDNRGIKYWDLGIAFFKSFDKENLIVEDPGTLGLLAGVAEKFVSLIEFGSFKGEPGRKIEP